jgi:hypothetical protein
MEVRMKQFLAVLLVLAFATTAEAQWSFVKVFPDTGLTWSTGLNNGLGVDPAGNVWMQSYSGAVDSIGDGTTKTGVIRVFSPTGVEASFSPIKTVTTNGVIDTLTIGYGGVMDPDGNFLSVKPTNRVIRINYKTGEGMARALNPIPGYTSSIASVAVAAGTGEVFLAPVLPGPAGAILNADLTPAGLYADTLKDYGRTLLVSANGNDVYVPRFGQRNLIHFHSDNGSLGPYTAPDTMMLGLVIETMAWDPKGGGMWLGSGNTVSGMPDSTPVKLSGYAWYLYNLTSKTFTDSIKWNGDISTDPRPRGIAFSPTGDTVYVGAFNASKGFVQMFKRGPSNVQRDPAGVANSYTLSQNYPNPFNPSTQIKFSLLNSATITLKVYDVLGKEVATLAEGAHSAGAYTANFDAANLSTGVYYYTLKTSDGFVQSKKMLLVK